MAKPPLSGVDNHQVSGKVSGMPSLPMKHNYNEYMGAFYGKSTCGAMPEGQTVAATPQYDLDLSAHLRQTLAYS
ncbi:hypothetical protein HHS34_013320 [Acidithiobacillus montserratensis]|uniref:Uncharacterized protein n=1 Tax=Acidithiobacillus montserratensis TaxID=2729135 RepID=A0ACD5HF24_9PROT|nr:hypothetical protein [Acidithiobacillus montserratensis]MBN2680085.1 hypothetical protein [Acidithiobacillaceae bacterium]MBU2747886.1 hypothetical protein [Acidithiobacillus montserratensis]